MYVRNNIVKIAIIKLVKAFGKDKGFRDIWDPFVITLLQTARNLG